MIVSSVARLHSQGFTISTDLRAPAAQHALPRPGSARLTVRSIADSGDRLVTVNSALAKASALDPQPVLGRVGDVSGRLYGLLVIA